MIRHFSILLLKDFYHWLCDEELLLVDDSVIKRYFDYKKGGQNG